MLEAYKLRSSCAFLVSFLQRSKCPRKRDEEFVDIDLGNTCVALYGQVDLDLH